MNISRRTFLTGMAGAAVAPLVPALSVASPVNVIGVDVATGPSIQTWTMWAVGSDPESFDWRPIAADSEMSALEKWFGLTGNDPADFRGNIAECVQRVAIWDDLGPVKVRPGDWIDAGMGHHCFRCDCECWADAGARNLDGEVVCEECITIADIVAHDEPDDVIERLADEIADRGEDGARKWIDLGGADVPAEIWAEAVRRAAT